MHNKKCWKKQAKKTAVHIGFVIFAWLPCMETIREKKGSKTKTHANSKGQFFLNDHAPLHPLEIMPLLFYLTLGISTWYFFSTPGNFISSTPPVRIFFWNSPMQFLGI